MEDYISFYIFLTIFPLLMGFAFYFAAILPVFFILLGTGTLREKGSLWGNFVGLILSSTIFRILISLFVKIADISLDALHYIGIVFLILFGLMLIFPKYALWNRFEAGFKRGFAYGAAVGFVWSFWVGLFKAMPVDYYEPKWIGSIEVYLTLISAISASVVLGGMIFIISLLYRDEHVEIIQKILGLLTIVTAVVLPFHVIPVNPREGLKPEESTQQVQLHEIFGLPDKSKE